jgi:hypothetical protein
MYIARCFGVILSLLLLSQIAFPQQLKLGKFPYDVEKSAVLELKSDNQGLLLPRIADTALINTLTPPDGMAIFFIPTNQLLLRANGHWEALGLASSLNNYWSVNGNSNGALKQFGNIDDYSLPFITNNTERMLIDNLGNIGIGTSSFDATNPEKLLIDAGTTTSFNLLAAKGSIDNYLQLNIQNRSNGTTASSDIVATADNGTESINYIDMGINSSGFTNPAYPVISGINNAYLYSTGNDFIIGNAIASKNLKFFTGGYATTNERMRIDGNGLVGIGVTAPTAILHLKAGTATANTAPLKFTSGPLMTTAAAGAVEFLTDKFYGTITTSAARKEFTLNEAALTSGRIPVVTTNGRLTSNANFVWDNTNSRLGVRATPTAFLHLGAGTAAASTAPLKFTTGTNLTTPEAGAVEFNGTHFYGTIGSTRYQLDQQTGTTYTGSNGITLSGNDFRNDLITGIAGGQTITGGTAAGNSLTLSSTNHATKGNIVFGTSVYDEVNNRLGIANSTPSEALDVTGNFKFSGALMPNNNAGTSGYLLRSNGVGTSPSWVNLGLSNLSDVSLLSPTNGQLLQYNGTSWINSTPSYLTTIDTSNISNFYLKVRGLLSAGTGITYDNVTGTITNAGVTSLNGNTGALTMDTGYINNFYQKVRSQLNAGSGISYDAATGIISSAINTANFWDITGNTGTNPATNFIGTTDNQDLVFKTNSTERARIISSSGDIKIGSATTGTIKATQELVLRQDGDTYGSSILRLRNRSGENGAIFETTDPSTTLVDFIFKTSANQRNIRYEGRAASARTGSPSFHIGGANPDNPTLSVGDNYAAFNTNLKIGNYSTPTEALDVTGNLRFSGALMPNNSAGTSGYLLKSNGAGTAPSWISPGLSNLSDVSLSSPTNGQLLQYNGTSWINSTPAYLTTIDTSNISNFYQKVRGLFSGTAPITFNAAGQIGITLATTSTNGYLNNTDWNTFNSKGTGNGTVTSASVVTANGVSGTVATATTTPAITLTLGAITPTSIVATGTVTGSNLSGTNTGNVTIGTANGLSLAGQALSQALASTSVTGALSNTDWNTFNNKLSTIDTTNIVSFSQKVRSLFSGTAPITYSNGLIGITQATTSTNGYLSNTDWNTFNSKGSGNGTVTSASVVTSNGVSGTVATATTTPAITLTLGAITPTSVAATGTVTGSNLSGTNTGNVTIGTANGLSLAGQALSQALASTSVTGALSNTDWNTFNNKLSTIDTTNIASFSQKVRSLFSGTAPITYTAGVIGISQASTSTNGYLSSTDWNTFNNKAGTSNTWTLTGNSGINPLTNFIGTTDNKSLRFRTNNTERLIIDSLGRVGIGITNPTNPLVVKDTLEIRRVGSLSQLLFTNTAGTGDFRIGGDGGDIFWQGGGGRALQMGSHHTTILGGDRLLATFPAYTGGITNTGVLVKGQRDASVPLAIQGNSATQTANLTEWRNSSGTALNVIDQAGRMAIGATTFNSTNPEELLIDAGSTGNTNFQNVIVGKGNTNSYAQLNIQNGNAGTAASSDVVATADNGNESVNFVDMGINSSVNTQNYFGGLNDAYLYAIGNGVNAGGNLYIGTATASRDIAFLTGGGTKSSGVTMNNERMRILGTGNVGIANGSPTEKLDITGNLKFSGALMPGGTAGTAGHFLVSTGSGSAPTWFDASNLAWQVNGNSVPSIQTLGTTNAYDLPFITNNTEKMRIRSSGGVGIGTSTFNGTNPEELIVDAGSNGSGAFQNVIVGKGNTNSYAQLNIQNTYSAAGNSASSDVVATSDNGNESVNFIDMGINSGTNTTTGVLGGANTAYLYTTGGNLAIGTTIASKDIVFFTGTSYTDRMHITSAGHLIPTANNAYNLGSSTNRWATIYSQNALNTSDARLKTNISDLNYGLTTVLNMRPVRYNWKEGADKDNKIGFLAQDLRKIIPEVVVGDESKEPLAVNYIELIPVLVNAIKEQQKQIDDLTKKVKMLEKK